MSLIRNEGLAIIKREDCCCYEIFLCLAAPPDDGKGFSTIQEFAELSLKFKEVVAREKSIFVHKKRGMGAPIENCDWQRGFHHHYSCFVVPFRLLHCGLNKETSTWNLIRLVTQ